MSKMPSTETMVELIQERSQDALLVQVRKIAEGLSSEEFIDLMVTLLLAAGADRDALKAQVSKLLATRFGSKSEQSNSTQLELFEELMRKLLEQSRPKTSASAPSLPVESAAPSPSYAVIAASLIQQTDNDLAAEQAAARLRAEEERKTRKLAAELERSGLQQGCPPPHLPKRIVELPVPAEWLQDGYEVIRKESSWTFEKVTRIEALVFMRPVLARRDHVGGPLEVPVPPKPVDKGHIGFSVAAEVLWLRTVQNLPLLRIEEMMVAQGIPITESMIHTLIETTGKRAEPLVQAIHNQVKKAGVVNLDDTPVHVYEGAGTGKRKRRRARVWLALGDERFAYFFATKTWKSNEAKATLGSITGVLQGDGYPGFPRYAQEEGIPLAGCMAHLRRKMRNALEKKDPRAVEAMALIQGLYRVEELARLRHLSAEQRLLLRQERSRPIMQALLHWGQVVQPTIETGSPLGQAWTYLSKQQRPLQTFLEHGEVEIDNNAAERGLRRITIGRKLWLFFRQQERLEYVSGLMSISVTARLHGVDELAYWNWVLQELARREWSPTAAEALLPAAWLAAQKKEGE